MQRISTPTAVHSRQGGAVIIVVVSLMAALAFLGFFFFTFADQEQSNARNYASAESYAIDPDPIFDFGLRQVIVSTPADYKNSALYMEEQGQAVSKYSLLAHILGTINADGKPIDSAPYSGRGIGVLVEDADEDGIPDDPQQFTLDFDGDGVVDADQSNFRLNFSAAANGASPLDLDASGMNFDPDAGYTYPDINSLFLAYDAYIPHPDRSGDEYRVLIPSFFRPQLFPDRRYVPNGFADLYESSSTVAQVFRPHRGHVTGVVSGSPEERYLNQPTVAQSGDRTRVLSPFPFRVDVDGDGIPNELGVWDPVGGSYTDYDLDADADGDGVHDSILIDLDHPLVDLPGGRQVVPLYFFKIEDADGLLNVNTAGNLRALEAPLSGDITADFASLSNLGLGLDEPNLGLALTADPQDGNYLVQDDNARKTVFVNHGGFFGVAPSDLATIDQLEMSNMELAMLLQGRPHFTYDDTARTSISPTSVAVLGRYGEGVTPIFHPDTGARGGASDADDPDDDDGDANLGANYVHPLDFLGMGRFVHPPASGSPGEQLLQYAGPLPLPFYDGYWQGGTYAARAHEPWEMQNEGDELIVETALRNGTLDDVYQTSEMMALRASDADLSGLGIASRLLDLASFNLRDNSFAERIRKRLTTDSWERLEFGHGPSLAGLAERDWEFNTWKTSSGDTFTHLELGVQFALAFPPAFSDSNAGTNVPVFTAADPYRGPLRWLLARVIDSTVDDRLPQQRLNINAFLDGVDTTWREPQYVEFTPHVSGLGAAPATDPQELEARRQRQQMARDIYVLLYTLGGGDGLQDYARQSNSGRALYTDEQLREMAQFAVNVVDALDPDDVITLFEYDTDLSNGWDLDDNPYSVDSSVDREVVAGVERQQLTLSEVLLVFAAEQTSAAADHQATQWDDSKTNSFAYIELQNTTHHSVDFASQGNAWRIVLDIDDLNFHRALSPRKGSVAPGERYAIGTAGDDSVIDPMTSDPYSEFWIDPNFNGSDVNLERIIPAGGSLDLDLIADEGDNDDFSLIDPTLVSPEELTTPGAFFDPAIAELLDTAGGATVRIRLQRRVNLDRDAPALGDTAAEEDNPWVTVDEIEFEAVAGTGGYAKFQIDAGDTGPEIQAQLGLLVSLERTEPFMAGNEEGFVPSAMSDPNVRNSIKAINGLTYDRAAGRFRIWQPHYDRPFSSVMELLCVPIVGPDLLTRELGDAGRVNPQALALARFLHPQHVENLNVLDTGEGMYDRKKDNAWYRLFEFIEVPDRSDTIIRNRLRFRRRIPGKVNLNTLRDETVLAALLDDDFIVRMMGGEPAQQAPTQQNSALGFDSGRNWFDQLLAARDVDDAIISNELGVAIPLPGVPGSRPFRPLSYVDPTAMGAHAASKLNQSLQHTILRSHAHRNTGTGAEFAPSADPVSEKVSYDAERFGLFEARDHSDVTLGGVDPHTYTRLLAKLDNLTTTRSTVFTIFAGVQFHEAHETEDGYVQIGGRMQGTPVYRQFLVVDMSRLEEAYDPESGTFDFRKFIIHRQMLP